MQLLTTNAAASATSAATSLSNIGTSEANAATSATNCMLILLRLLQEVLAAAEATFDLFDDAFLGSKTSDPSVDNDGNALQDGALYFDTTNDVMKVYNLSSTQWLQLTPTVTNQNNINAVNSNSTNINAVASNSTNINSVASDLTGSNNIGTTAGSIANVNLVGGSIASVNTAAISGLSSCRHQCFCKYISWTK